MQCKPHTYFVSGADGLDIFVEEWGGGPKTCVLLHGLAEGSFIWHEFATRLAPFLRVLSIDLRGHGRSFWHPQGAYSFNSHVSDIRHILNALNLQEFILIGHSLGGCVAAYVMAEYDKSILGACLVDANPSSDPETSKFLKDRIALSYREYKSVQEYEQWLSDTRPFASVELLKEITARSLIERAPGSFWLRFDIKTIQILSEESEVWWRDTFRKFDKPVLVIRGKGSAVLKKNLVDEMIGLLRRGRAETVDLAGHAVMTDNPAGFADAVIPFVLAL